jgi:diguanylate cyclase (GGDEF)-like protein
MSAIWWGKMPAAGVVRWTKTCIGLLAGLVVLLVSAAALRQAVAAPFWVTRANTIFQTFAAEQGFPTAVVFDTAMDRDGFLWVATGDGLVRWDGYRARVYHPHPRSPGGLPDNFIQALHVDAHGGLWIGTAAGGLARYSPATDDFRTYGIAGVADTRIEIDAFADDGAGGLWVGGEGGLYHLSLGAKDMDRAPSQPKAAAGVPRDRVLALLRDKAGVLWAGTEAGLFRRNPSSLAFTPIKLGDKPGAAAALARDGTGMIWVATPGFGVFRVSGDGTEAHQVIEPAVATGQPIQMSVVYTIAEVRPGVIWLGTASSGIIAVDEASLAMHRLRHDPATPTSLADDAVFRLYRDRTGIVWAATAHGLCRADPANISIMTMLSARGEPNRITDPDIDIIRTAPDGRLWLGLVHDGVNILDPATGTITAVPPSNDFPAAIVDGLAAGPDGRGMYVGTWRGLFYASADGKSVRRIALPGTSPNSAVTGLAAMNGALWIGSNGLKRMQVNPQSPGTGVVESVVSPDRLTDSRVRVLTPDGTGKLWIGTFDGINLFDPVSGKIVQAVTDPADPTTLSPGLTACLFVDNRHRLWVCTGGGLSLLTGQAANGRLIFRRLGVEDGLPNLNVDTLLQAKDGVLWASTDDGLARIDPDTLHIEALHAADGVVLPAYWNNSGAVAPDGHLVFGGPGGLTIIDPDRLASRPAPGHLALSALWVGGKPVPVGRFNGTASPSSLVVQPDANSIAVEFSALDMIDPRRIAYAYKLDGFDNAWVETDASRRVASYSNLPPRRYVLRLRSSVRPGIWQDAPLTLPITVMPAWYQTVWCRLAAGLLTFAAILIVIRMQTLRLRARQHELEKQIAERTAELRTSNRDLAHAAAILGDLSVIGQQITANLDTDTVFTIVHDHVAGLLGAPHCAIYLLHQPSRTPVPRFVARNGRKTEAAAAGIAPYLPYVVRAIQERQEITVGFDEPTDVAGLMCAPLIVLDRVIGVMVIQSRDGAPYGDRERMIFRTLCAYGAIALGNAETLAALADTRAQLEQLAYTDIITNLPNRRAFGAAFDRCAALYHDQGAACALLLIDIDRFKHVNDAFGHDAGDALLAETAQRLSRAVRAHDIVARLGGDEFAIILCHVRHAADVEQACERVAAQFTVAVEFETLRIQASVSIGAALFPADGETQELLYKAADQALYEAKRSGRNTWRQFAPARYPDLVFRRQVQAK